ncbi:MAG: DUF1588 domain-containing protein [Planctomycetota bacterium]|nr:DUF1588 domain-containing protein [Planctomycetota bacterium]
MSTAEDPVVIPLKAQALIEKHCFECHSDESAEAGVRLDGFNGFPLDKQLVLLNQIQDQLFFRLMPPDSEEQPDTAARNVLTHWLRQELQSRGRSNLDQKLRLPNYGNYVDHTTLFDGSIQMQPYTPSRRWLVSPQIFLERVNDVFGLEGRNRQKTFYGVTNPFVLSDHSGVRDYDTHILDGGHLLVMMNNAKWIANKQLLGALSKTTQGSKLQQKLQNPKDRWIPPNPPPEFIPIVDHSSPPTQTEMIAAIRRQFRSVLRRSPLPSEQIRYLNLLRSAIQLGGNENGLKTMLSTVLLESEFLYRIELGINPPDASGRKPLSPQESAFAIAYALGDRGPDPLLFQAANQGRLKTPDDFRREVTRLINDKNWFFGPVDPALSGKNMKSHFSTHPKQVRFFREFFGYPSATKVFKDLKRSDGYYQNPSRGTAGTPGFLVKEADRVVDWVLSRDQDVFQQLLTTNRYFVYHDKDNAAGKKTIEEWTEAYHHFKTTDWKNRPDQTIAENEDYIKARKSIRILGGKQKREFLRHMYFWEDTIGKGRTPFTTVSFAHGYTYNHSPFYNLPPTPHIFRYNQIENKQFKGLDDVEFWDYPTEQPFQIQNRKGLLTHPAWLIAHSGNFQTDPIRRGRWIREKLLAGRVPDVPITVDAQVPDNPHKTFRERVEQVTTEAKCWKCHQQMNPLGLTFEGFDDFGRYRLEEPLESPENLLSKAQKKNGSDLYRTKPVNTRGYLQGTGDPTLDGNVNDAFDLIDRLAKSERVRQSFIRHAFRFFMGRNELLSDSRTLIEADRAYLTSGGSFKEVVISLLSSDSFIYRRSQIFKRNPLPIPSEVGPN